ncbi:2'-5' RNA ligase family protein [Polymorphospora lycopeni]|uniref:Phage protease n=1 Tax=Polymorphospora lycopeni TaxID=3140240 RepID=A0ABV5CKV6_9ACTN
MADLARRDGIELIRTGSWETMTGTWNPTPADIAAAIAAQDCPAIRKPVIKLGHVDKRFDGEPALGWFENLRSPDGGHTLVGDQVTLPWLAAVQAAAYPSRSIEGHYNHRCGAGHVHPFVLTAVALLGVTPPAVRTLRNLNDLPGHLGVAAGVPEGAEPVQVTIMAAEVHTGAMVALIPTEADAERLAVDGGEPAEQLHVTLAYLGDAVNLAPADRQDIIDTVSTAVNGMPVVEAEVFALSAFNPGDVSERKTCIVAGLSGDLLDAVHTLIGDSLQHLALPSQHAPWHAHMTLQYTDDLSRLAALVDRVGPVRFDRLRIALAGQHIDIPLIGGPEPDEAEEPGEELVAAADGDGNNLKRYWLGKGLSRWATKRHPWTTLYRLIRKHVGAARAKRIASQWFHDHFGYWPGDRRHRKVRAAAQEGELMTQPTPPADEPQTPQPVEPVPEPLADPAQPSEPQGDPILPAAEPEPAPQPEPEEDTLSTLNADVRSRLGLAEDADDTAILAALDALKTKADTPPQPDPQQVAAAAKAEEEANELRKEVKVLASQVQTMSQKLADAEKAKADTIKASVLDEAEKQGKFKPADRAQWETDYDEAPAAITRVLASIAPGTAVPVAASGYTGEAEPTQDTDAEFEAMMARLDGPTAVKES